MGIEGIDGVRGGLGIMLLVDCDFCKGRRGGGRVIVEGIEGDADGMCDPILGE